MICEYKRVWAVGWLVPGRFSGSQRETRSRGARGVMGRRKKGSLPPSHHTSRSLWSRFSHSVFPRDPNSDKRGASQSTRWDPFENVILIFQHVMNLPKRTCCITFKLWRIIKDRYNMFTILLRSTLLDTNLLCDTFLLVLCQHLFRFSLSFQVHQFPFLSRRKARSVLRKNSDFTVHKNDSFKCYGKISQLSPQKRNFNGQPFLVQKSYIL